jgi:hypothetical protein
MILMTPPYHHPSACSGQERTTASGAGAFASRDKCRRVRSHLRIDSGDELPCSSLPLSDGPRHRAASDDEAYVRLWCVIRSGIPDRHASEVRGRGSERTDLVKIRPSGQPTPAGVRRGLASIVLPVEERGDADTELPAKLGDGYVSGLLSSDLVASALKPLCETPVSRLKRDGSPGIASNAIREQGYHALLL